MTIMIQNLFCETKKRVHDPSKFNNNNKTHVLLIQVKTWFQNRRMKWKKGQQTEVRDSPGNDLAQEQSAARYDLLQDQSAARYENVSDARRGAARYENVSDLSTIGSRDSRGVRGLSNVLNSFSSNYLVG